VSAAATTFGWASYETDWRALVARDDIGLVEAFGHRQRQRGGIATVDRGAGGGVLGVAGD